jgi:site-specific recombinase XerD
MKRTARLSVLPQPTVDPWPMLWQSFERSMRAEDASPRTLEVYSDGARLFHAFLRERNLPTDPKRIEKQHVEDFLIWLREDRNAKPATVRARFSTLRRFFNWCVDEEEIEHSPMARMHGPKVEEPAPEVLSEDEQRRLLAACRGETFEDRRDAALIRLMLDAGLRRGEVASIKVDDLDLDGHVVRIIGKGNRPGVAFFGVKTARDLDRYLRLRSRHSRASMPALWLAQKGALTGDGIHHLIARRAQLAGIERKIHPHLTRHSWAHAMKSAGASDEDVMTLGRWRDRKVMGRYGASAAQARAQETHRRLSPGDRI